MEAIDSENGEVIENISSYLEQKYKDSSENKKDLLFDDYGWAVYSLVYLAATSGSIVKKERDIITTFIKSIPHFSYLEDEWIDKSIRELYRPCIGREGWKFGTGLRLLLIEALISP